MGKQLDLFREVESVEDLKNIMGTVSDSMREIGEDFEERQQFIGSMYISIKKEMDDCKERLRILELALEG